MRKLFLTTAVVSAGVLAVALPSLAHAQCGYGYGYAPVYGGYGYAAPVYAAPVYAYPNYYAAPVPQYYPGVSVGLGYYGGYRGG